MTPEITFRELDQLSERLGHDYPQFGLNTVVTFLSDAAKVGPPAKLGNVFMHFSGQETRAEAQERGSTGSRIAARRPEVRVRQHVRRRPNL